MADFRYKSLKSWKIDNIDLTQQFGSSIFTDFRYQSIKITWLIATDFYRLTTPWHVHQKKNLTFSNISNPLFITLCRHKPCVTKRRATTDFHANSNPLEDICNPPRCDVTLLFRTFPKVAMSLGLVFAYHIWRACQQATQFFPCNRCLLFILSHTGRLPEEKLTKLKKERI